MARERMVTRTVELTVCEVMCVDVTTAQVAIKDMTVSGKFDDDTSLIKAIKKAHETDTNKVVAIQSKSVQEVLYGMPEVEFIKLAKVLPPRTKVEE